MDSTSQGFFSMAEETEKEVHLQMKEAFEKMMGTLFQENGTELRIEIMQEPGVTGFIETHSRVLDSAFGQVEMSEVMRRRLQDSNYIFSGLKTFHELNEAFPSLLDENGNKKPFKDFLNDVQTIDKTYNENYLKAEYNFATSSAEMAARWESFQEDGDRYNLQYRTAGDNKVRDSHRAMDGITLPMDDPFWNDYFPPNGWNCRCTVVQVRKSKYPETSPQEAERLGEESMDSKTASMFRFNPGKQRKAYPDHNPYSLKRCNDCDLNKLTRMGRFIPDNEMCAACEIIRKCAGDKKKSQKAIERTHYLHLMKPLLEKKVNQVVNGENVKIGFTGKGNKHLFADTFGRTRILRKEDLKNLDTLIEKAKYIESSGLTHSRNDEIKRFHYYKVQINGGWIRLNVAEMEIERANGKIVRKRFLYSINDIKE